MSKINTSIPDFINLEKEIFQFWQKQKIANLYLSKNKKSKKRFSFLDGPITANNPMGVHHAWGRTYKDLWQRFFNMQGCRQRFQNGFDEQGLWVEVEVERELGLTNKKEIENLVKANKFESIAKFVNLCKERVKKFSQIQAEQSRRLGYFMDWDNSYHTSSDENNYAIWHYLKTINEKGWLYKGRDSVPWCPRCGTAISQHEILTEEYQEVIHKAVFVKYPVINQDFSLLVWTTTPWTLPGNVAVAVNPDLNYEVWEWSGDKVLFAEESWKRVHNVLREKFESLEKFKGSKTKRYFKGSELLKFKYKAPFDKLQRVKGAKESNKDNFHKIIASKDLVTAEEGTGLVHVAPGAGEEDFKLSQVENLPVIELIDEEATYIDGLGEFTSKNAKNQPEIIIDYLDRSKFLFAKQDYSHRYPTCWRCKTELVWRVVDEWYIAMDKKDPQKGKSYREMMKGVIRDINWIPKWGYDRELDWLNNMDDWLISKKRYWGLTLPIWECAKCGNFVVIGSKEELRKKSVEGWGKFEGNSPHRPWIDQVKIKCLKCKNLTSRISDVGNPWLDAGIVPFSTISYFTNKKYWQQWFPADFIVEAFPGQFKNWFYCLISMSTALENRAPFKTLLGHGMVRDEKSEEMHKSKGNAIEFNDAAELIGVDVMRWIYLRHNPEYNLNFGFNVADEIRRRFFLIFWNCHAFFQTQASVNNWQFQKRARKSKSQNILDQWILSELYLLEERVTSSLKQFDAMTAARCIETFVIDKLSAWYIRRSRERFNPNNPKTSDKLLAFYHLQLVLLDLTKLLAPFIPYLSEYLFKNLSKELSVHLSNWPQKPTAFSINYPLLDNMDKVREVVERGHAIRKEKGIKVRQPLQLASVYGHKVTRLKDFSQLITDELNIKQVLFKDVNQPLKVKLDTNITDKLKEEGKARDFIRQVQQLRKASGLTLKDKIEITVPFWPINFTNFIKKQTLAVDIKKGKKFVIAKV